MGRLYTIECRCGRPITVDRQGRPAHDIRCYTCEACHGDSEHGRKLPEGWREDGVGDCKKGGVEVEWDGSWYLFIDGIAVAMTGDDAWPVDRRWNALQAADRYLAGCAP